MSTYPRKAELLENHGWFRPLRKRCHICAEKLPRKHYSTGGRALCRECYARVGTVDKLGEKLRRPDRGEFSAPSAEKRPGSINPGAKRGR